MIRITMNARNSSIGATRTQMGRSRERLGKVQSFVSMSNVCLQP